MSEFSMNWLLHKLDAHEYTVGLHAFPRTNQAQKFSKQRLESAISDSKYIKNWYAERESELVMRKFLKEMNDKSLQPHNFYILGGTWESRKDTVGDASRGISLDFIVYDERQDHPNDVETVLGEGASHSEYKQTLTLGTPKLPGIQFDQQWESSNKMYWFVKCEHCGYEAPITMDNILDSGDDEIGYFYGCPHCRNPLRRNIGVWRETRPGRRPEYHGYHINQLMVTWLTANEIMKKKNSPTYPKRRFYNEVLGESYGGDDIPITLAMMEACCDNQYNAGDTAPRESLYAGIDWGGTSYCYLQNKQHRCIDVFMTNTSDPRQHAIEIAKFLAKYKQHVKKVVCDAGPDISRYYNLKDACKTYNITNQVWACYYATPPAKTETSWNDKEGNVTTGRSEAIEQIIDEIHAGDLIIPGLDKDKDRFDLLLDHFTNIAAEKSETKSGNAFIMYVNTGPDHFLHAKIYADVASGGIDTTVIAGSAPPAVNPRENKTNGIFTQARSSNIFPVFSKNRRR